MSLVVSMCVIIVMSVRRDSRFVYHYLYREFVVGFHGIDCTIILQCKNRTR